jgi:hypothetical protein
VAITARYPGEPADPDRIECASPRASIQTGPAVHPGRPPSPGIVPGHRDKYALVERERRFLLAGPPAGGLPAEVELDTDADLAACPPPHGSVAEVTCDDRFTGGQQAVTPRAELLSWLAEYGVTVADQPG